VRKLGRPLRLVSPVDGRTVAPQRARTGEREHPARDATEHHALAREAAQRALGAAGIPEAGIRGRQAEERVEVAGLHVGEQEIGVEAHARGGSDRARGLAQEAPGEARAPEISLAARKGSMAEVRPAMGKPGNRRNPQAREAARMHGGLDLRRACFTVGNIVRKTGTERHGPRARDRAGRRGRSEPEHDPARARSGLMQDPHGCGSGRAQPRDGDRARGAQPPRGAGDDGGGPRRGDRGCPSGCCRKIENGVTSPSLARCRRCATPSRAPSRDPSAGFEERRRCSIVPRGRASGDRARGHAGGAPVPPSWGISGPTVGGGGEMEPYAHHADRPSRTCSRTFQHDGIELLLCGGEVDYRQGPVVPPASARFAPVRCRCSDGPEVSKSCRRVLSVISFSQPEGPQGRFPGAERLRGMRARL
jgi:hypothetical protein